MFQEIKKRKPLQSWVATICMGLVALAGISISTTTGFWWYETDCPKELFDK